MSKYLVYRTGDSAFTGVVYSLSDIDQDIYDLHTAQGEQILVRDGAVLSNSGTDAVPIYRAATASELTSALTTNDLPALFSVTEESKLEGIEANATQDQSNAEIKSAYEANADTNA